MTLIRVGMGVVSFIVMLGVVTLFTVAFGEWLESEPVLRDGDIAVVDVSDREPENGALFLIEWSTGDRNLVETYLKPDRQADGTEATRWSKGAYSRPRSPDELERPIRAGTASCADGPYARPAYLAQKLIGKVIGVLASDRNTRDELSRRIGEGRYPSPRGTWSRPVQRATGRHRCPGPSYAGSVRLREDAKPVRGPAPGEVRARRDTAASGPTRLERGGDGVLPARDSET